MMEDQERLINYLSSQVKGYGLGDVHEKAIREGIATGKDFEIVQQRKKLGEVAEGRMYFKNGESGTFFNRYKVSLQKPGSTYVRQRMFHISNKQPVNGEFSSFHISLREACNLVAGRSVTKEVFRNGEKAEVYLSLDFKKTDKYGNAELTVQYPEYGFKLGEVASRYNFSGELADHSSKKWLAFTKGDLTEGQVIGADGQSKDILAGFNSMYKNITLYDANTSIKITTEELAEKQFIKSDQVLNKKEQSLDVKKNEQKQENKSHKPRNYKKLKA